VQRGNASLWPDAADIKDSYWPEVYGSSKVERSLLEVWEYVPKLGRFTDYFLIDAA